MMHILYLVQYRGSNGYLNKMSRVRFHGMEAVGKLVDLTWWGPGFEEYDETQSVRKNIDLLENIPDLIVAYKPLEMKGIKDVDIPVCLRYNETYDWDWTTKEIDGSGAEFVIFHHKNDKYIPMSRYQDHYGDKIKFVHIPHCAEKEVFKDYGMKKKYDIMIGGSIKSQTLLGQHYPLRNKLEGILQKMFDMGYKVYHHPHPGYIHDDAYTDKYLIDFAKAINEAKICLTCSGAPKSRFGKYIEIPMCGTAIAADIPNQDEDEFKEFVIELTVDMSDSEIIAKLREYLDNSDKLNEVIKRGLEWSKGYTQEYYAKRFVEETKLFIKENK